MENKWHHRLLELANLVSTWSKDSSTQVGCVIADVDHRVLSLGYNGLARKVNDDPEAFPERHDREKAKYSYYIHAELNAIFNANAFLENSIFYVTLLPCLSCVSAIIQTGAAAVVYDQTKTDLYCKSKGQLDLSKSLALLEEAGIASLGLRTRLRIVR